MEIHHSFESNPDAVDQALEQESTETAWRREPHHENEIHRQIQAYTAHVLELAEKTGKTKAEIVAAEKEEIRKAGGISEFLKTQSH